MTLRLKPLADQAIVITGASSGIGLATAHAAAGAGARVLLVARNEPALQEAVEKIRSSGGSADYAIADVDDRGQVEAAAAKAVDCFGRIDTWVNNAGVAIYAPLLETPEDAHRRMVRTNYFGVVNGCLTAVRHLRDNGGALITVGSIAADMPSPILGAYAATKHATKGYVESLRIELGAAGLPISVTLVKPSGIDTPIGEHALNLLDGEALIPPPVYDPSLVAQAILDCAVHPRREITVGGAGRMQALFAEHFPVLFEKLAPMLVPKLSDKSVPKTGSDALDGPAQGGNERSTLLSGRTWSAYTSAKLHPALTSAAMGLGTALLAGAAWSALRKPAPKARKR